VEGNSPRTPDPPCGDEAVDVLDSRMAALSGSLVVVHCHHPSMDLWFLMDLEKQLWVKQHSINVNLSVMRAEFNIRPLLVLNDGRILTFIGTRGLLRIYNPRTSTYTDVAEMGTRVGIGLYTGNLLSSANGAKKPTKLSKWCQLMRSVLYFYCNSLYILTHPADS